MVSGSPLPNLPIFIQQTLSFSCGEHPRTLCSVWDPLLSVEILLQTHVLPYSQLSSGTYVFLSKKYKEISHTLDSGGARLESQNLRGRGR